MNIQDFIPEEGKLVLPVPKGIRYIGEWIDFDLGFFGQFPFIIDKQIPGCGFTEYCLTSGDNIILASPRLMLLDNKEKQHPGDVHFAKNECENNLDIDKDISKLPNARISSYSSDKTEDEIQEEQTLNNIALQNMETRLMSYCTMKAIEKRPLKIIVTYDSFKHVKRFLANLGLLNSFKVVVDEFQSIFVDSRFKASVEFDFMKELKTMRGMSICFVSATPMIDKYLKQLDYFKDLPYFELNWELNDPGRVMRPELKVRKTKSINSEIKRVIREYREGKFSVLSNPVNGSIVQSKEAVFYVNSVNNILAVIKAEGLKPEEVNILCSDTANNRIKLKKRLGVKYKIGTIPLRGEQHKMFTFCTRTVYLGADFYSLCARTFVFSDANIDSLAVDISLDLPQILGRQRLIENPWKNHAEFYFKNLGEGKELTQRDFENRIQEKLKKTSYKLSLFQKGNVEEQRVNLEDLKTVINYKNYKDDYVSISQSTSPKLNELVLIAERRAYDIQQIDYKNRFTVFSLIRNSENLKLDKMSDFISKMRDTSIYFSDRLKELCETSEFTSEEKKIIAQQTSERFDKYFSILGPERCKALSYDTYRINREINDKLVSADEIKLKFLETFRVGEKYKSRDIKIIISKIYNELGLSKTPKGTDIMNYFNVKPVSIYDKEKGKFNGFEIISEK